MNRAIIIKVLRNIHAWFGFLFSIFFISSSITGIILVFRKEIPTNIKEFVFRIHTLDWGILKYWLILVGLVLFGLSSSGIILFFFTRINKK